MRLLPTTAFSIALAAMSVGFVMPSAATAAKKDEKAEASGPKLQLSKEFQPGAVALQKLFGANDFEGAKAKIAEIEPTATKPDDKYFLGQIELNVGLSLKDEAMQRKGLEAMLGTGLVPEADAGKYHYFIGQFAQKNKDWSAAHTHYEAAAKAGFGGPTSYAVLANSYFGEAAGQIANNQYTPAGKQMIQQGLPYLKQAIEGQKAAGAAVDPSWYTLGFQMATNIDDPSTSEWTKDVLAHAGTKQNWSRALLVLMKDHPNMTRDESLDVLRLMQASKSLPNAGGYSEYAENAWKEGLPGEVKSVIDGGRASGELQPTALADLYKLASDAIAKDKASLPASEKSAAAAATGKPAEATANAYFGYGDYAKAIELYRLALQKGGVDANEVNTRLGIALSRSGDKAGAIDALSKVNGPGVRKQIADLWSVWVNNPTA